MVEFIICDDNKDFLLKVEKIINSFMLQKSLDYRISKYYDYDEEFLVNINKKTYPRIYILDIETPSRSGINVARLIRKKDLESAIIFLTGHEELGAVLLRKDLLFLAFINKFDEFETRLIKNIDTALSLLGRPIYLRFKDGNVFYNLPFHTILYITTDSISRKTVIITDNCTYKITIPLKDISKLLDNRFYQTHRACFVNIERASKLDFKSKIITFDNKLSINLLSENYKKGELSNAE